MERITTEEELEIANYLEVLDEDILNVEKSIEESDKVKQSLKFVKELEYFSDSIIIVRFVYKEDSIKDGNKEVEGDEYTIYQVYNRDVKKSSYHYIADEKLEKSLLLNLINKGDILGNKSKYLR